MKTLQAAGVLLGLIALACAACSARADANANPNSPSAQTPLRGTEWAMVEINGKALAATGSRPPTLTLAADGNRASGVAGCNQFSGAYTTSSDNLRF